MAKFGKSIISDDDVAPAPVAATPQPAPTPPPAPQSAPQVTVVDVNNSGQSSVMAQQTVQMASVQATAQADASVGLASVTLDKEIVENQLQKQDEHWMKSMWRPAMGWLYMVICFMDFVAFPAIAMFMPLILKGAGIQMQYVAWQSLTLSNGGLIHMAFGAILGVAAYGRTQEKVASKQ
jgi:hypothetical protein